MPKTPTTKTVKTTKRLPGVAQRLRAAKRVKRRVRSEEPELTVFANKAVNLGTDADGKQRWRAGIIYPPPVSAEKVVKVPGVPAPTGVCWKLKVDGPRAMSRCGFQAGHAGLHQWEIPVDRRKKTAFGYFAQQEAEAQFLPPRSKAAREPGYLKATYAEERRNAVLGELVDKAVERMQGEHDPSVFETRLSLKIADIVMAQEQLAREVKALQGARLAAKQPVWLAPPDKSDRAVKPVSQEWRPWVLALLGEFDVFSAYATREQLTDRLTEYCEMERLDAARLARQQGTLSGIDVERAIKGVPPDDIHVGDQVTLSDGSSVKVIEVDWFSHEPTRYTVQLQDGREVVTRKAIVAVTGRAPRKRATAKAKKR